MSGPLAVGAQALRYWEARQANVSNNLANVSTPGFKGQRVFARLLDDATLSAEGTPDFSSGSLSPTGRPLDVALGGEGFLTVETSDGPRWVRGGSFNLDASGVLTDAAGNPVLGEGGPIVLPPGPVEITSEGVIRVGEADIDRLRVEWPAEPGTLQRAGSTMWIPADGSPVEADRVQVRQGHLEESNVDPVTAMVEMIEVQRAYTAVQRSMQATDGIMQTITTEIGRVSG